MKKKRSALLALLMATALAVPFSACVIPVPGGGGGIIGASGNSSTSSSSVWDSTVKKDEQTGLKYQASYDRVGYEVCGYEGTSTHVVIPATFQGLPVVGVFNRAFEKNETITEVTLGENLEILRDKAFFKCTALTKVNMVPSLKIIGPSAFANCTALVDCLCVEGLEEIHTSAFANCYNLAPIVHTSSKDSSKVFNVFFIPTTVKVVQYHVWSGVDDTTTPRPFYLWYKTAAQGQGSGFTGGWAGSAHIWPYATLEYLR